MRVGVQTPRAREEEAVGAGAKRRKEADGGRTGTRRELRAEKRNNARQGGAPGTSEAQMAEAGKRGTPSPGQAVWGHWLGYSVIGRTGVVGKEEKEEKGQS